MKFIMSFNAVKYATVLMERVNAKSDIVRWHIVTLVGRTQALKR